MASYICMCISSKRYRLLAWLTDEIFLYIRVYRKRICLIFSNPRILKTSYLAISWAVNSWALDTQAWYPSQTHENRWHRLNPSMNKYKKSNWLKWKTTCWEYQTVCYLTKFQMIESENDYQRGFHLTESNSGKSKNRYLTNTRKKYLLNFSFSLHGSREVLASVSFQDWETDSGYREELLL